MVVNPKAVKAFLKRKLANSDKAKSFTIDALDRKLSRLDPPPKFVFEPWWHQKVCFLLGERRGSYFFMLDMGLGKSKISLDLFAYDHLKYGAGKLLVLVPNSSNVGQWLEEIEAHAPHLSVFGCTEDVTHQQRRDGLSADIFVITYNGWLRLVCKNKTGTDAKGKEKRGFEFHDVQAKKVEGLFSHVAFDESDSIKNHRSLFYRAALRLSKSADRCYCLSGTPMNRDPQDFWSQFRVVDGGETLGQTLGLFRAAFFTEKPGYWGGAEYTLEAKKSELLYQTLRNRSIRFSEHECLNLPERIGGIANPVIRAVKLPKATWTYYEKLIEELDGAKGNFEVMKAAYMRMRMICSGFLPVKNPEGESADIIFKQNPLLDELEKLLTELGPAKVIIAHVYQKTGALICERLKKMKIKHLWLYGKTKKKNDTVAAFKNDATVQVLVCSRSGARGLNLQHTCHRMVFYETMDDPTGRKQMEKRIARPGQEHTCFYWDLVVEGGPGRKILKSLKEGKVFFDLLVDGDR